MKRVTVKQAETERECRAIIIRTQGELTASENLSKAMAQMTDNGAITLHTLQTIESASISNTNL